MLQQSLCHLMFSHHRNVLFFHLPLLHEILHAIVYASSLNSEGGALEDHKDEEQTVNSITNHLMAVIKDNPWFLDFLKEQIKPENQSQHQQKLI